MKIIRIGLFFAIAITTTVAMSTLGCFSCKEASKPKTSITARVVDYGIYKSIDPGTAYPHPESTAGYAMQGVKVTLINRTTKVPLQKGIVFGFEYEAEGFPPDVSALIIYRVKHPPITKPDGKITNGFDEPFPSMPTGGKLKTGIYYQLSEDWELVPGEWSITVIYEDTILVEKVFEVSGKNPVDG